MDTKRDPLIDSGLALTTVTAILYCASAAYTGGYNTNLGLDGDVLDRNFQQTLYDGFLISFGQVLRALAAYTFLRFCYSEALLPAAIDSLRKHWRYRRFLIKIKRLLNQNRKKSDYELREKKHTRVAASITGLAFVLVFSLVYFESQGREKAIEVRNKLAHKSFQPHELLTVTINGETKTLLQLACGARNCAGIDPVTRIVHYFPQNGHSSDLRTEKRNK